MRVVLDAGALIGLERSDRRVAGLIALARRNGADLVTPAPVVGQVWRDGARQAELARALKMIDVRDTDLAMAKSAGQLLGASETSDVTDALVALLSGPGDQILTSDPDDLEALTDSRPGRVSVVAV